MQGINACTEKSPALKALSAGDRYVTIWDALMDHLDGVGRHMLSKLDTVVIDRLSDAEESAVTTYRRGGAALERLLHPEEAELARNLIEAARASGEARRCVNWPDGSRQNCYDEPDGGWDVPIELPCLRCALAAFSSPSC